MRRQWRMVFSRYFWCAVIVLSLLFEFALVSVCACACASCAWLGIGDGVRQGDTDARRQRRLAFPPC